MNKAAQALGRLARGVPKHYSSDEIERRSKILAEVNARKRKKMRYTAARISPEMTPTKTHNQSRNSAPLT